MLNCHSFQSLAALFHVFVVNIISVKRIDNSLNAPLLQLLKKFFYCRKLRDTGYSGKHATSVY